MQIKQAVQFLISTCKKLSTLNAELCLIHKKSFLDLETKATLTKMKTGSVYFKDTESILKLYFPLVKYS